MKIEWIIFRDNEGGAIEITGDDYEQNSCLRNMKAL